MHRMGGKDALRSFIWFMYRPRGVRGPRNKDHGINAKMPNVVKKLSCNFCNLLQILHATRLLWIP